MAEMKRQKERLIVLFIAGVFALNYPLLALCNRSAQWLSIPVLYVYLSVFWALFIALLAAILERKGDPDTASLKPRPPGDFD